MKEYYGQISFSGRISFSVKAKNEEEAKNIIYDEIKMNIDSFEHDILEVTDVEWDLISKAPTGNMGTPFVHDFEIYEEKE